MNQLGSQEHHAHYLVIVIISKQLVQIHTWVMRTRMNGSSFCYAKSLHCRLMIVIIGTHNTDVLSTKAVNDLVMILYYDACYAHRSLSSKDLIINVHTDLVVLAVATLNELDFLSTLLFLILDPNHQEHFHWYTCLELAVIQLLVSMVRWRKVVPHVTNAFVTLTVYII